jgi:hypothetical protein
LDRYVELIPNLSLTSEDWLEKYEELSDIITQHLKDQRVSEYPEVKNGIELMQDSVEEFRSLDEFISWVFDSTADSNVAYSEYGLDDIEKTIEYFESAFSQDIDRDIETKFHNFFISLKDTQGIEVSEQQINRLHEIVTKCYEQTGRFATIYRRILIKLSSNKDQFNDSEKQ